MKKIFLIAIFITTTIFGYSQEVAYLSFAPDDNGIGLRIDMNHAYASMTYGNYRLPFGAYIKDHAKIGLGVIYKNFSLGMAYHSFGRTNETVPFSRQTLKPVSIELGGRVFVYERLAAALRYDVLRHEGTVEFGITFL